MMLPEEVGVEAANGLEHHAVPSSSRMPQAPPDNAPQLTKSQGSLPPGNTEGFISGLSE